MLVTLNEVLKDAQKNGYGVGLFNTLTTEMARGVIDAAEELQSPVIIGTAEGLLKFTPLEMIADLLRPMAERASVPVVLHFDHGFTKERIMESLKYGFTSVMYDCSTLPYESNVKEVAELTRYAHLLGATVEGELGHVGSNANPGAEEDIYTRPEDAKDYAERTGVDALAVAVGTAHGVYKVKPVLDLERLAEIRAAVDVPLVLHGGSGLSDDDFRNCIKGGVAKVNIFTDINIAAAKAAHDLYEEGRGISTSLPGIADAVKKEAMKKMTVFGSAGRG